MEVLQNYSSAPAALDRPFPSEHAAAPGRRASTRNASVATLSNSPHVVAGLVRRPISPALFCAILLLLPVLAVPALIALGRSDYFLRHGASVWVQSNDAIFNMRNRDCDVLVFGDSTAMTGVNPAVVQQDTGFRTCNIAVTNAVLAVTDNLALDQYLAHNSRPRVLLIQLSPDDFQRTSHAWHRTIYAEGLLELLRHGSPAEARSVLLHHPREAFAFAGYTAGYSSYYAIRSVWSHLTHAPLPAELQDHASGAVHDSFFSPPAPARTYCEAVPHSPSELAELTHRDFPRSFTEGIRQQYSGRSGVVLVNVAPIPACDENLSAFRSQLAGVTSNPVRSLPVSFFNDGRHYTAAGSRVVSHLVADELNEVADENPSIDDRHRALAPVRVANLHR